jgi:magnesium transporter
MLNRYTYQSVTWIDVESPTTEDVEALEQEFNLGPLLAQELLNPTLKPHVDVYPDFAYAVLHFPSIRSTRGKSATEEVDFILGKSFIVTVHYDAIPAIEDFQRTFETATLLKRPNDAIHSGHILFELTERLYQGIGNELDSIEDTVGNIEKAIFSGREREMVAEISNVSRELLVHKRTLGTHQDTLDALEHAGVTLFGESFRNYLRGIAAFHFRAYTRALSFIDTVTELRNTNDSLLSARQNEIVKNLTIVASLMLPLTLVANIFSMNTRVLPIIGAENDFWIILGAMALLTLLLVAYFKAKKWF